MFVMQRLIKLLNLRRKEKLMSTMNRKRRGRNEERETRMRISEDEREQSNRHPRGLRGKEIGLFYARRGRERREKLEATLSLEEKMTLREERKDQRKRRTLIRSKQIASLPLGRIILSDRKKEQIKNMLKSRSLDNIFTADGSYSHIEDSHFKRNFLSTIKGNLIDKLTETCLSITAQPLLDEIYTDELNAKKSDPNYISMLEKRKSLPSYSMKEELIKLIEANQIVVVSGETGCGKTTQVAQFILDHYIENGKGSMCKVVCTQPRRISAISVAERVADERIEPLGKSVGYHIRLERCLPRDTGSICFCTTGVVLRQMEGDPALRNISHIILDEIHERNIPSDFLMAILKEIINKRKDLKVILMSATLNSEAFSSYFYNCPHINIPGFTYPVAEYFLEDVLQRTKFEFKQQGGSNRNKWKQNSKKHYAEHDQFIKYIQPYVRNLEREGKYDVAVCAQLKNPDSENINLDLIAALIEDICKQDKGNNGSILVFLTGYMEILNLYKLMETSKKFPSNKYLVIPLHSMMPTSEQKSIFKPAPEGKRKIIISTNIAETSITIDDVVFVIDCGKIKINNYDLENDTQTLQPEWETLANSDQRRGRAGRVKPGVCFHLFSKARHMILEKFMKPEILRVRPDSVILTEKILQLGHVESFFQRLMDPPDSRITEKSLELLRRLNALDDLENLTPLGYHLARLPISPQMGKMILFGAIFSCLDPILGIAASLDFKDAFQIPFGQKLVAENRKLELSKGWQSDHLLLHRVLDEFEKAPNQHSFCWHYFVNFNTLNLLQNMKKQFMEHLLELNFVSDTNPKNRMNNKNSGNLTLVKAIVCSGLYPNVAVAKSSKHGRVIHLSSIDRVNKYSIHPKSVLNSHCFFDFPLVVYSKKVKSTADFIHDASVIHPLPVVFFGDKFSHIQENNSSFITIAESLRFAAEGDTIRVIRELRSRLNSFLEYKITHPGIIVWDENSEHINILRAIMELITSEETGQVFQVSDESDDSD